MKITKLTDEQIAMLPAFVDKWVNEIGLNTDPADFEATKHYMKDVYKAGGLTCPGEFTEFRSPREAMRNSVKGLGEFCFGSMDAHWLSHYDTFMHFGLDLPQTVGLIEVAKVCGWFAPYDKAVVLTDRPCEIHRRGIQLHNEEGPSVLYRDGFCVWSLNGVRVDEQIVMRPETQTTDQIRSEQNEEVKRIRIERYGWEKYLDDVGAKEIDSRKNPIELTNEILYKTDDGMKILVCACPSTAKVFSLEVDPEIMTCEDAQDYLSSGLSSRIISAS